MTFRRILIAVDDQPVAAHAADVGVALARALGADLAVITVVDLSSEYAAGAGLVAEDLAAGAERDAKQLLSGFRQRLSLPPSTLEFVERGAPAAEIVKAASEWRADLIVVGSHGRGGIERALVGSVADGVLRHAPCPILVVRAKA
jgi:nucleotide-binding universal stress UspA family protein